MNEVFFAKWVKTHDDLIGKYWKDFREKDNPDHIVTPSIPIIWFGNLKAYLKPENLRVVTIGINPSLHEFQNDKEESDSNYRFPSTEELYKLSNLDNKTHRDRLFDNYNNYFATTSHSYRQFFLAFEKVLQSFPDNIKTSYGYDKNAKNIAIHIDFKTALATNKLWKNVDDNIKKQLSNEGLFNELLDSLKPEIVLVSSKDYKTEFLDKFEPIDSTDRKYFKRFRYNIDNRTVIYGRNLQGTPFGGVSAEEEKRNMEKLLNDYR